MEKDALIHDLQQRLSDALASEAALKSALNQGDREQRDEIQNLQDTCRALQQTASTSQSQLQTIQHDLMTMTEGLQLIPEELQRWIRVEEMSPTDKQILIWTHTTVMTAMDILQHACEVAEGSPLVDTDSHQRLENALHENRDLKKQLIENGEQLMTLQSSESELGADYNALLAEYERLCEHLTQTGAAQHVSEGAAEPSIDRECSSELNNVMMSMEALQMQLGGNLSPSNGPFWETSGDSRNSERQGSVRERLQNRVEAAICHSKAAEELLIQRGADVEKHFSEALMEQGGLQCAVSHLGHRDPRLSQPDRPTDAQSLETGPVQLVIHVSERPLMDQEWRRGALDHASELGALRKRLWKMNRRFFDLIPSCSAHSHDEALGYLHLEMPRANRKPFQSVSAFRDDLYLHRKHCNQELLSQILTNADALRVTRCELGQLRDTVQLEHFLIAEQQTLLQSHESEIQQLTCARQRALEEISILSAQLEEKAAKLTTLQKTVDSRVDQRAQSSHKLTQLTHSIASLEHQLRQLETEHKEAEAKLRHETFQKQQISHQLRALEEETQSKAAELESQERDLAALHDELNRVQRDLKAASKQLHDKETEKAQLTREIQKKSHSLDQVVQQGKSQMTEIQSLKQKQTELESTLSTLQHQCGALKASKIKREATIESLQNSTEQLSHQLGTLKSEQSAHDAHRNPPRAAGVSESPKRELTPDVSHQEECRRDERISRNVEFIHGPLSGDLLIQCLEKELQKQEERIHHQEATIEQLQEQLSTTQAPSALPVATESAQQSSLDMSTLQATLKQALNEMDTLYERVVTLRAASPVVAPESSQGWTPSITPHRPQSSGWIDSYRPQRSLPPILKTRGQIRSELASAEKQVSNLEQKMKGILRVSSFKDRLIQDLQKQLTERQSTPSNTFWRY